MIIVHHLENSRSQRVLWLLEELALPYEVRRYERNPKTMLAPPELRRVHPLGKSPLIEHEGRVVAETGAIAEYLVELADGRLAPTRRDEILLYRHFLHYAEGSLMPPLLVMLVIGRLGILGRPARGPIRKMIDRHVDWLETELAQRPWFAGEEFTAADIMMSFPLEAARHRAGLGPSRPNLTDWLERIHARPAYGAALAKGGPYAYA
ncbi:MAG TPA: glutathione S-transferase [Allosphingosinicella sp.]|nr:glutathione S-transferase [Allosphingosinicella sp.]